MSRVIDLRYVALGVPDLVQEREFFVKWGLTDLGLHDGLVYFAAEGSREHHVVRLRQTPEKRVDAIGLKAATRADVDALHDKVVAAGAKAISKPHELSGPGGGYGFRFFSPDGITFEISSDVEERMPREFEHWDAIPKTLSHVAIHSPDHEAQGQFFVDVLGFKITDKLDQVMVFLRCNEFHHRLGFLRGPAMINHVSFDYVSVDAMMRGIGRLKEEKVETIWGPGRHTPGDNAFSYYTTPAGFGMEVTTGLEVVDFENREIKVYEPALRVMDQWGVGIGGPHAFPTPHPDKGLFDAAEV